MSCRTHQLTSRRRRTRDKPVRRPQEMVRTSLSCSHLVHLRPYTATARKTATCATSSSSGRAPGWTAPRRNARSACSPGSPSGCATRTSGARSRRRATACATARRSCPSSSTPACGCSCTRGTRTLGATSWCALCFAARQPFSFDGDACRATRRGSRGCRIATTTSSRLRRRRTGRCSRRDASQERCALQVGTSIPLGTSHLFRSMKPGLCPPRHSSRTQLTWS